MLARMLIGAVIGGAIGFGVHRLAGCSTGACPLTGNPWISMIYGGIMGVFVASSFR